MHNGNTSVHFKLSLLLLNNFIFAFLRQALTRYSSLSIPSQDTAVFLQPLWRNLVNRCSQYQSSVFSAFISPSYIGRWCKFFCLKQPISFNKKQNIVQIGWQPIFSPKVKCRKIKRKKFPVAVIAFVLVLKSPSTNFTVCGIRF